MKQKTATQIQIEAQAEIKALRNIMIYGMGTTHLTGTSLTETNFNQIMNDVWGIHDEDRLPIQRAKALKRWLKYH